MSSEQPIGTNHRVDPIRSPQPTLTLISTLNHKKKLLKNLRLHFTNAVILCLIYFFFFLFLIIRFFLKGIEHVVTWCLEWNRVESVQYDKQALVWFKFSLEPCLRHGRNSLFIFMLLLPLATVQGF